MNEKYIVFLRKYPHWNSFPGIIKRTWWKLIDGKYQQQFEYNIYEPRTLSKSAVRARRTKAKYNIYPLSEEDWEKKETDFFIKSL